MAYTTIYPENFVSLAPLWDNSPLYTTPRDADYLFVAETKRVQVAGGDGYGGANAVRWDGTSSAGHYVAFDNYGPWDATCGRISTDFRFDETLPLDLYTTGFAMLYQLKSSADTSGMSNITLMFRRGTLTGGTLTGDWQLVYNNLNTVQLLGSSITNVWWRYEMAWRCGTNPVDHGIFTAPTADNNGYITVRRQALGSATWETLFTVTGIGLVVHADTWFGTGIGINQNNHAQIGSWGAYGHVLIEQCAADEPPLSEFPNQSVPCCCAGEDQPFGGTTPETGPVEPVDDQHILPEWDTLCVGGGNVPDAPEVVDSETWV
jgi:hypothetical protein